MKVCKIEFKNKMQQKERNSNYGREKIVMKKTLGIEVGQTGSWVWIMTRQNNKRNG